MNMISVISIVFLTTCTVSGNPLGPVKDSSDLDDILVRQNREDPGNYELAGCYKLEKPLKKLKIFGKYRKIRATGNPLIRCMPGEAKDNDDTVIGIQKIKNKITCREGKVTEEQWKAGVMKKYELEQKECQNGVGSKNTISIYRKISNPSNPGINQKCTFEGEQFEEGKKAQMYNKTDNELNGYCQECECSQGEFRDCHIRYYCDVGLANCAEIWLPPGECCPECKSTSCGQGRKFGEKWQRRKSWNAGKNEGICSLCECKDGKEFCEDHRLICFTPPGCQETEVKPDFCCPQCKTTTTIQPTTEGFIIPLTTEGGFPTFPFPFDINEDQEH